MSESTIKAADWPVIAHVIGPFADWWRRQAEVRRNQTDIEGFGPEELSRVAQDVGLSASDLRSLAAHCTDAAELLERRLEALGLSADELAHTSPAELRDMERLCTTCRSKGRCAHDLVADPDNPVWQGYCPNKDTLASLKREASI